MGALRLSYHWERIMTLFVPALVAASSAAARPVAATARSRDVDDDDDDDDDPTTAPRATRAPLALSLIHI